MPRINNPNTAYPLERSEHMSSLELVLTRIVITEINSQQVIIMREKNGNRQFPILIGIFEATTIDRRVKHVTTPRPLTHDLLCSAIEMLGGTIQDVYIYRMEEQTYYATLRVRKGNELLEIDCRPSDAIAVAVSSDPWLPILIDEEVFEQAVAQSDE